MDKGTQEGKEVAGREAELAQAYTRIRDMLLASETTIDTSMNMAELIAKQNPVFSTPLEKTFVETTRGIMHLLHGAFRAIRLSLEWQKESVEKRDSRIEDVLKLFQKWIEKYGPLLDEIEEERQFKGSMKKLD